MFKNLFEELKATIPTGERLTFEAFVEFVDSALVNSDNFYNFDASTGVLNRNHSVTAVYTGFTYSDDAKTDKVYNGNIAVDFANRSNGEVRILGPVDKVDSQIS